MTVQRHRARIGTRRLEGELVVPEAARGLVAFAHGSGSSRLSPRNANVADALHARGFATLLFDLLTEAEAADRRNVFDIPLLAVRVGEALDWTRAEVPDLPIGLFGASTGAAAALVAAADAPDIAAVVSRGGRPDLAGDALDRVRVPVLLIVGGADHAVLDLNRAALDRLCSRYAGGRRAANLRRNEPGRSVELMGDLVEKVRFLSDPAAYGANTGTVEARETHMSWVFLTKTRVYKLKKPIRRPHLDFSTIERRRHFCAEEVRLNRRLAAPTYRGVLPLCRRAGGSLELGGSGPVVDWLVEMVRLTETEMLDAHIADGRLAPESVERLAETLAEFYASRSPEPQDGAVYMERLGREVGIDRGVLLRPRFELGDRAVRLLDAADAAPDRVTPEIEDRARRGLIVEGHGDLRPEHVWLGEPLQIIDCLEFDRGFRLVDPWDELRYLGLECAVLGAEWVGPLLLSRVGQRLGDPASVELLALYAVLRALTRARLCLAHLLETPVRMPAKWRPLAIRYLAEAERARLGGR